MKKISIYIILLLTFPFLVGAISETTPSTNSGSPTVIPINIPNPTNAGSDLMSVLRALLEKVVMPVAAVLVVMYIIYSGFLFVKAQGKPADLETAKKNLLWALIGAGILLGAVGISAVVERTVKSLIVN